MNYRLIKRQIQLNFTYKMKKKYNNKKKKFQK